MQKEIIKFESQFNNDEQTLIILTGEYGSGAGKSGPDTMWTASQKMVAYVDDQTGNLIKAEGRLEWLAREEQKSGWIYNLNGKTIYRVKVRKSRPDSEMVMPWSKHHYQLLEVLDRDVENEELAQVRVEYETPVIIMDPVCGKFELNKELHFFAGEVDWLGEEASVALDVDAETEDGNTIADALKTLHSLTADVKQWDQKLRLFAAEKLTELANDWLQDAEEDHPEPITEKQFAGRIGISEIAIHEEGEFEAYYYDDDMFWGHIIIIEGNVNGELTDAYMAG